MAEKNKADHSGHRERMRARFLADPDLSGFSEHEILEMLLFYCYPRVNTNELAHSLINRFGSIDGVLSSTPEELIDSGLVRSKTASSLNFFYSLCAYLQRGRYSDSANAANYRETKEHVQSQFFGLREECIILFPVDKNGRIDRGIRIKSGATSKIEFRADDICRRLAGAGCSEAFIAHNHPIGNSVPSEEDIVSTRLLAEKLSDIGIVLIDHLICGTNGVWSMREHSQLFG